MKKYIQTSIVIRFFQSIAGIFRWIVNFYRLSLENSFFLNKYSDFKINLREKIVIAYYKSALFRFQWKMLRTIVIIRRNFFNSFFMDLIFIKIFLNLYRIYLRIFSKKSQENSIFLKSYKEFTFDLKTSKLSYTGTLILIVVAGNIFLYYITGRFEDIDWVGWYFRSIWTVVGIILLLTPYRFDEIKENSKGYKKIRKFLDQQSEGME